MALHPAYRRLIENLGRYPSEIEYMESGKSLKINVGDRGRGHTEEARAHVESAFKEIFSQEPNKLNIRTLVHRTNPHDENLRLRVIAFNEDGVRFVENIVRAKEGEK